MANLWKPLAPHNNVFVAMTPMEISNNISIPKPVISTISNWLETEDIPDPIIFERMALTFSA